MHIHYTSLTPFDTMVRSFECPLGQLYHQPHTSDFFLRHYLMVSETGRMYPPPPLRMHGVA